MYSFSKYLWLSLLLVACAPAPKKEQHHAVILVYEHFAEPQFRDSNLSLEKFDQQIKLFKTENYHVLPVDVILAALQTGKALPSNSIGITIDHATESFYQLAYPRLKQAKLPFTLMIDVDEVGQNHQLSWQELQNLNQAGVDIGLLEPGDATIANKLPQDQQRLKALLGHTVTLMAYTVEEIDPEILNQAGIKAAFQNRSGAIDHESDFYALPRFLINESYSNQTIFNLVALSRPLKVNNLQPANGPIGDNPPLISFELTDPNLLVSSLSCYQAELGRLPTYISGAKVVITPMQPFSLQTTQINCTVADKNKAWYWLNLYYAKV